MIYLLSSAWLLTILSLYINKKDLIAPSFLFSAGFTFAITWATVYADKWRLYLHRNTFFVLVGGMAEFILVCAAVQWWMSKVRGRKKIRQRSPLQYFHIPFWAKLCILAFTLLIAVGTILSVLRIMGSSPAYMFTAITSYRESILFEEKDMESLPSWVTFGRVIVLALGYWFLYVFINNRLIKRHDWLSLAIVVACMLSGITLGSRGELFFMIVSAIVVYVTLRHKETGFRKSINLKTLLAIVGMVLLVLFSFRWTAEVLGRYADFELADYIAIYCGAQIKNLDIFLQESYSPTRIFGGQTFINFVNWLGTIIDINIEGYELVLPFRYVGDFNLGNVYTTFYPYIYDFGIPGLIILVGLMAILVQWNYERVKRVAVGSKPSLSILLYSYMSSNVFFSFFSNKFYENMVSIVFFRVVLFWILFNWLFCSLFPKVKINE